MSRKSVPESIYTTDFLTKNVGYGIIIKNLQKAGKILL